MGTTRQSKISNQLQKDLAEILRLQSNSITPGKMLTVTKVNITPDLGLAQTNVSVFPSENAAEAIDALNNHKSQIRKELGIVIRHQFKKVPDLKFYLDDSLDYIENIDNLLHK